jgi:hypothetical protein
MPQASLLPAPRWQRLRELLDQAMALPEPQRQTWLATLPAADADLLPRLQELVPQIPHTDVAALLGTDLPAVETGDFTRRTSGAEHETIGPMCCCANSARAAWPASGWPSAATCCRRGSWP